MRMAVTRAQIRLGGVLLLACVLFAGTVLGDDGPPRISVLFYYTDTFREISDEYLDEDWAKYRYRPPPPHVRLALQIVRRLVRHGFEVVGLNAHEHTRQIYNRLGEMASGDAPLVAGELARMLMVDVVYLVWLDVETRVTDDGYCHARARIEGEGYDSAAHRIDAWVNRFHQAAQRECDRAIIAAVDDASASVGRVLGDWKNMQQSAESDASAEDIGARSSGSGGNGRAAEISPFIDVRLEGATSYEIAEVFGRGGGHSAGSDRRDALRDGNSGREPARKQRDVASAYRELGARPLSGQRHEVAARYFGGRRPDRARRCMHSLGTRSSPRDSSG